MGDLSILFKIKLGKIGEMMVKKDKNLLKYLFGTTISNFGNSFTALVFPLMILDLTGSTFQLSVISAIKLIPYAVLGLPLGAIVDRLNLKKAMLVCDFIQAIAYLSLFLSFIFMSQVMIIISIYAVAIISGICVVMYGISEATLLPRIVDKESLAGANSLLYGSQYITGFIVPIIGGSLYSIVNTGYFFLFDGLTFFVSFMFIYFLKGDFQGNAKADENIKIKKLYNDTLEGLRVLFKEKQVFQILILMTISNLVLASYYNYTLIFSRDILNIGTDRLGVILGITSVGSLIGSFIASYLLKRFKAIKIIICILLLDGTLRLFIPFNQRIVVFSLLLILLNSGQAILNILIITYRQREINTEYLGRINSIFKTTVIGVRPLGLLLGGAFISSLGITRTLVVTAIISLLLFLYSLKIAKE